MTVTTAALLADSTQREALTGTFEMLLADRNTLPNHPALIQFPTINGSGSSTGRMPLIGVGGYNDLASTNDGDPVGNTVITDDNIEVVVARHSKSYSPTDLARMIRGDGALDPALWAEDAFISMLTKITDLVANLAGTFTDVVGVSGTNLDVSTLLAAKTRLRTRNVTGPYLCVLHPQQTGDLVEELATTSGGAVQWMPATPELINQMGSGYIGRFAGIDLFETSRVPTVNGGADRAAGMWGRTGVAWGAGTPIITDPTRQIQLPYGMFEYDRLARSGRDEWVTHAYLGASKGNDDAGVSIITDA